MEIDFTLEGTTARARLEPEDAPATCAALASLLPLATTAHYAKIAGNEFMLHLPAVLDVERARAVAALPPGCVAFWPERQLLCVYYGPLQDEDATVTVLGQIVANLEALGRAADGLRRSPSGGTPRKVRVEAAWPHGAEIRHEREADSGRPPAAGRVWSAYAAIAAGAPDEVRALCRQRGIMRPGGPLLYAEADTRTIQETLWQAWRATRREGAVPGLTAELLRHAAGRLRGWYALPQSAAVLESAADALPALPASDGRALVEALLVYVGRLNLWLDAAIPWNELNSVFERL